MARQEQVFAGWRRTSRTSCDEVHRDCSSPRRVSCATHVPCARGLGIGVVRVSPPLAGAWWMSGGWRGSRSRSPTAAASTERCGSWKNCGPRAGRLARSGSCTSGARTVYRRVRGGGGVWTRRTPIMQSRSPRTYWRGSSMCAAWRSARCGWATSRPFPRAKGPSTSPPSWISGRGGVCAARCGTRAEWIRC